MDIRKSIAQIGGAVNPLPESVIYEVAKQALSVYRGPLDIEVITQSEASRIFESGEDGRHEPIGYYITASEDGVYTAIDNSRGYAWTEDFDAIVVAIIWLENPEMSAYAAEHKWEQIQNWRERHAGYHR